MVHSCPPTCAPCASLHNLCLSHSSLYRRLRILFYRGLFTHLCPTNVPPSEANSLVARSYILTGNTNATSRPSDRLRTVCYSAPCSLSLLSRLVEHPRHCAPYNALKRSKCLLCLSSNSPVIASICVGCDGVH